MSTVSFAPPVGSGLPSFALTACVLAISSLTVLANATIAPSLPGLARAFADTQGIETLAGLVLSLPSLAIVLTAAAFGWGADRFDRRTVLVVAMLVYALGGASGALAQTMPQILAGRLLLGVGVTGTLTIATKLAADLWHGADRARFMGWQGAAISATGIASVAGGGMLAELSWRVPFALYLVALPIAAAARAVLPRRDAPVAGGGVSASPGAPFPWRILALAGGLMFLAMAFIFLSATRLPFLLEGIGVASPGLIGLTLALMTAASFPTGLFYGRVRARFEPRAIAAFALALMGTGYAIISQSEALPLVMLGIAITGSGLGLIIPNQNVLAHGTRPRGDTRTRIRADGDAALRRAVRLAHSVGGVADDDGPARGVRGLRSRHPRGGRRPLARPPRRAGPISRRRWMTESTDGATFWEAHYRAKTAPSGGRPSAALVRFAGDRALGRALDLGCARGDDAIWLARQGWHTTGVDVSETAVAAARDTAAAAGVTDRTTFARHDLSESFPEGRFDLVTALFLHSPANFPRVDVLRRAAGAVAPGGLMLTASHASVAPWSWSDPGTAFPTPGEELAELDLDPAAWTRVFVGAPEREATGPDGQTATVTDNILALERVA